VPVASSLDNLPLLSAYRNYHAGGGLLPSSLYRVKIKVKAIGAKVRVLAKIQKGFASAGGRSAQWGSYYFQNDLRLHLDWTSESSVFCFRGVRDAKSTCAQRRIRVRMQLRASQSPTALFSNSTSVRTRTQ
jgi:hypothetical protein